MEEKNGITITVKQVWKENPCEDLNTTITWRSEHPDEHIENLVHGMFTCLVGLTFDPITILKNFKDFVLERDYMFKEEELQQLKDLEK